MGATIHRVTGIEICAEVGRPTHGVPRLLERSRPADATRHTR